MAEAKELRGVSLHDWLDKPGHDQLLTCFATIVLLYYN